MKKESEFDIQRERKEKRENGDIYEEEEEEKEWKKKKQQRIRHTHYIIKLNNFLIKNNKLFMSLISKNLFTSLSMNLKNPFFFPKTPFSFPFFS